MPEPDRSRPLHEQIHDFYARMIREGGLPSGTLMPSARQAAADWGVSVATADRALAWLVTDGLARRDRRGTVVSAGRLVAGPQQLLSARFPDSFRVQVTAAEYEPRAPRYIWPLLGLEPVRADGLCPVARREQVHYDEADVPFMLSVEWYHPRFLEAVPELLDTGPLPQPGGGTALIEARTGIPVTRGRQAREARLVKDDGREGPLLHLELGTAVLAEVWIWFTEADAMTYGEYVLLMGKVTENEWEVQRDAPAG